MSENISQTNDHRQRKGENMNHDSRIIDPSLRFEVGDKVMARILGEDESHHGRTDWYQDPLHFTALSPEDPFEVTWVENIEDKCTCSAGMKPPSQHQRSCAIFDSVWWLECGQRIRTIRTLSAPIPHECNRDEQGRQFGPGQASLAKRWTSEAAAARRARQEELLPGSSTLADQRKVRGTVLAGELPVGWFVWEGTHGRSGSTDLVEELRKTGSNVVVVLALPIFKKNGRLVQKGEDAWRTTDGTSVAEIVMDACGKYRLPLFVLCPMDIGGWDQITPSMAANAAVPRPLRDHCRCYLPSLPFMSTFGAVNYETKK
ncbi:MAG: hypothetical protein V1716_00020 [Candidatus Uhrbacteria bacterium]